ncbi:MAG: peptidase M42 [Candidatus Altiarchaeales archaeon IMC4]|nr:MAG: peptidase M42 [Candidatus Altiarchaeales archaeon IMC4]
MDLLEKLCRTGGISGFEDDVAAIMLKELGRVCDRVEVDGFGNVVGVKGRESAGKKKIMIAAHMDEVGFMVKHINKEGFISFVEIGGIDDRILLERQVIIKAKKGDLRGIIGSKPPHIQKEEERKKVVEHDEMFIDIGAKDEADAKTMVSVGDPIIFEPSFGQMANGLYYGKAVDDRLGCWALIKVMEALKDVDATVYAVATAQEEVGLKGARVAAFKINPDWAFVIDVTIAGDTPQIKETESALKLGAGPAITITEASGRGIVTHPKVRELLRKVAQENNIPYQTDVLEGGMSDGAIIYLTREGIKTGVVSIPTRYIHGPAGVFHKKDLENSVELVVKAVNKL